MGQGPPPRHASARDSKPWECAALSTVWGQITPTRPGLQVGAGGGDRAHGKQLRAASRARSSSKALTPMASRGSLPRRPSWEAPGAVTAVQRSSVGLIRPACCLLPAHVAAVAEGDEPLRRPPARRGDSTAAVREAQGVRRDRAATSRARDRAPEISACRAQGGEPTGPEDTQPLSRCSAYIAKPATQGQDRITGLMIERSTACDCRDETWLYVHWRAATVWLTQLGLSWILIFERLNDFHKMDTKESK